MDLPVTGLPQELCVRVAGNQRLVHCGHALGPSEHETVDRDGVRLWDRSGVVRATVTHRFPMRTPLRTARRAAHNRDPPPTHRIPGSLGTQPPKVGT